MSQSGCTPMVSVVMPSFNQARFIRDSIASVLSQSYPLIELIVADGGSGDETLEILRACQARDGRLRWFAGPDTGPAQALNKAMRQVRGTVIGWLNSDDLYTPGAIGRAVSSLSLQREFVAVYGHGQHIDESGRELAMYPTRPPSVAIDTFLNGCFICQPTMFFTRAAHLLLGPFDESLKTAFDFEYWLRLFTAMPGRVGFVEELQAQSRLHKDCITRRMRREVALEGLKVLRHHLGRAPAHWALTHIDEILAGHPKGEPPRELITEFVRAARDYVSPATYHHLAECWGMVDV
jgi:glycosyltransferase involved in cell wall biosynthesis